MVAADSSRQVWQMTLVGWAVLSLTALSIGFVSWDGIQYLLHQWEKPEYGYAYMLPGIVAFLVWQRKDELERIQFNGDWRGLMLFLLGLAILWGGKLSAVHAIIQYGLLLAILGAVWAYVGHQGFKRILMPLTILVLTIPLPGFIYQSISNDLQLISSRLGVAVIRLLNISVNLEGNVIDLGAYKLQVVEACNGLRYLFPLLTLGYVAAYFFKVEVWKRVLLFASAAPISVLMNSFRIGVIGILVEYWGVSMAEGFLHEFEGWFVFMACLGVLLLEMWVLTNIGRDSRPLQQVFGIEWPQSTPVDAVVAKRTIPLPAYAGLAIAVMMAVFALVIPDREDVIPNRESFSQFPLVLGQWRGRDDVLEQSALESLNLDDYLLADYHSSDTVPNVGVYVAYYGIQRADKVPHSPAACLPGGGWLITDRKVYPVSGIEVNGEPLLVNRFIIEQHGVRQLVYYWFHQRGRAIHNEYTVKWYLLLDSVTKKRSDGSLVRLTTRISPDETAEAADARLASFVGDIVPVLKKYIPD
ncbi:MAG: VPLPA-CTERM-specific exosortase XrtD [Gammaproteobacteria bacterium]|nr:VPLPA-CTERM-specific exosortase XrtD [Gammaproteobacteria bacterium]